MRISDWSSDVCSSDLHLRRDQVQRRGREDEDQREDVQRNDEGEAPEREDVEQRRFRAGQRPPRLVEPAGIRAGQQDPADGAEARWHDEGDDEPEVEDTTSPEVGSGPRPGPWQTQEPATGPRPPDPP